MKRTVIIGFALCLVLLLMVVPASASTSCVPDMDMTFIELFSDEPNTLHYEVELNGEDCGTPNQIGVVMWIHYISRTDVNQPWSSEEVVMFLNLLPDELAAYESFDGDFVIANQLNIADLTDDEFSKFRLTVVTYDHLTSTETWYQLGWMDGPNNWEVSGQFEGRPSGDFTAQQNTNIVVPPPTRLTVRP